MVRSVVLGVLLLATVVLYVPEYGGAIFGDGSVGGSESCPEGEFCMYYLNIGQGDATLIVSPTGEQVLIDAGPDSSVIRELSAVMGFFDKDIDMVIVTHPDKDHVAGFVDVFDRYTVGTILRTENESGTPVWQEVERGMNAEGAKIIYARRSQTYDLGGGAALEVLFPDIDPSGLESNTSSIIVRLTYGSTSFLFTGDSPKAIEEYLVLRDGEYLKADVLKVGHHGSRTSTSELFLAEVSPTYAIISAGKNNQYGHPHVEVTDSLFNYGVETHSTIDEGTIMAISNGIAVTIK
ncbi:MBL fold metallo-hydrolase [Candidatus Parcubacteria bacterium]|uniref:Metallo-beta-lactamase domain-containing protein n=1 Tax=Candidatus Kaiserbacteria bacterium CG10_big_fil_rev_8_21_14_0_10_47_16 TaxID=1974608 RepID=A0A2H0UDT6_9BACT|nr:MBL fold metallo-hydrolase [Candidatus Parcubacteria bacterium]PIR84551.1 MAG: hypothetical protein COU16_03170 [Candidatus Kaiserbacteria bacterium CG10_big_fil_rev_8_21_14_0_10_47_16]